MDESRPTPRRFQGDGGYTLTELLAVIAITTVIVPVMAMSFVLALKATSDATGRIDESFDSELLTTYFVPDAESASVTGGSSLDTPCDSLEGPDDVIRLVGLRFATGYRIVDVDPSPEQALERWSAELTDTNNDGVAECTETRTHIVAEDIENVTAFSDSEGQVALRVSTASGRHYTISASQRTGTVDLNSRPVLADVVVNCHNLTCDGTGSWSDPDGNVVSVVWDWGDGSPSGPDPHHVYTGGGTYTVRLTVGDDSGAEATLTESVTVAPNVAPVATGDAYTTVSNTLLTVPGPGVLGNDSDPNGDPLIAELDTGVAHGTLTLHPDGSFTYQPDVNYVGPDIVHLPRHRHRRGGQPVGDRDPHGELRGDRHRDPDELGPARFRLNFSWSGLDTPNVVIQRNGSPFVSSTANDGAHVVSNLSRTQAEGEYWVCEIRPGPDLCTNHVVVDL